MFYKTSIFIKVSVSIINWTILNLSYTRYVYVIDDNQFFVLLIPNIKCSSKLYYIYSIETLIQPF